MNKAVNGRDVDELLLLQNMVRTEFGDYIISPCKPYDGNNEGIVFLRRADGQPFRGVDCGGNEARAEIVGWTLANLSKLIDEYLWLWEKYSNSDISSPPAAANKGTE